MQIRPRYEHWLPRLIKVGAITLYPFVLFAKSASEAMATRVVHHECVHVRQVRTLGWFRFYASYGFQYVLGRLMGMDHNTTYFQIRFEAEAYKTQNEVILTDAERSEFGVTRL